VGTVLVVVAAVLFISSIVVLVIALRRPRAPKSGGARQDPLAFNASTQFGPRQIGPGAIVSYGGVEDVVRGGDQPLWFSVEEDDGRLELAMWVARKDVTLQPRQPYVVDGVTFHESERGRASYTTEGTTGLPAAGDMEFIDCANADESALLSFERWSPGTPWEISTGKPVLPGELTLYPAPPSSP
jgi:hypothetical protein